MKRERDRDRDMHQKEYIQEGGLVIIKGMTEGGLVILRKTGEGGVYYKD